MRLRPGSKVRPKDEKHEAYWTVISVKEHIVELHGPAGDVRYIPWDEFKYDWRMVK